VSLLLYSAYEGGRKKKIFGRFGKERSGDFYKAGHAGWEKRRERRRPSQISNFPIREKKKEKKKKEEESADE